MRRRGIVAAALLVGAAAAVFLFPRGHGRTPETLQVKTRTSRAETFPTRRVDSRSRCQIVGEGRMMNGRLRCFFPVLDEPRSWPCPRVHRRLLGTARAGRTPSPAGLVRTQHVNRAPVVSAQVWKEPAEIAEGKCDNRHMRIGTVVVLVAIALTSATSSAAPEKKVPFHWRQPNWSPSGTALAFGGGS